MSQAMGNIKNQFLADVVSISFFHKASVDIEFEVPSIQPNQTLSIDRSGPRSLESVLHSWNFSLVL
jgi:hypothetical protein